MSRPDKRFDISTSLVQLASLWTMNGMGLMLFAADGQIFRTNDELRRRTGFDEFLLQSQGIRILFQDDSAEFFHILIQQALKKQPAQGVFTIKTASNDVTSVFVTLLKVDQQTLTDQSIFLAMLQFPGGFANGAKPIENVQQRIDELSYVLDKVAAYAILSIDGYVLDTNNQFDRLLGYLEKGLIGKKYTVFIEKSGHSQEYLEAIQSTLVQGEVWQGDIEVRTNDAKSFWAQMSLIPLFNAKRETERVIAFCVDISKEKELRDKLEHLAYFDEVTGLKNRNYMRDYLTQFIEDFPTAHIFMYTIHVEPYADFVRHMGHNRASEILVEVAKRLQTLASSQLLAFYSESNEFIVCALHQESKQIQAIAEQIRAVFLSPYQMENGLRIVFRIRLGASAFPADAQSVGELYRMSRIALHRIQRNATNVIAIYNSKASLESYKAFSIANRIFEALQLRELKVWFQPKINLHTMSLEGAEALLRWDHPEWGIINAGEFMPIIQEMGLLSEVSVWAFTTVCQTMRAWLDRGLDVPPVSFNLPGVALIQVDLEEGIKKIVNRFRISTDLMIFEITETDKIQDENAAQRTMVALRNYGFQLSLDDFGSGYSELNYIRNFPVNEIKLDQHFIKDLVSDKMTKMIVQFVLSLAHSLKMKVVAEGIETDEQLSVVRGLDIDIGQGYLWSPAVPEAEFARIMAAPADWMASLQQPIEKYTGPDRREYFRVNVDQGMAGMLSLFELNGVRVNSGITNVVILNLGAGGMCFFSKLRLPAKADFKIRLSLKLAGERYLYMGHVVWFKEYGRGIIQYGCQFELNDSERESLIKQLNRLAIYLHRASANLSEYDLLQNNKIGFLLNK